jgi:hypothetical protein
LSLDSKGFVCSKKKDSKGFLQLIMDMDKLRKLKIWCKRVANRDSYMSDLSKAIQKLTKVPIDRHNDCSLSLDCKETVRLLLLGGLFSLLVLHATVLVHVHVYV